MCSAASAALHEDLLACMGGCSADRVFMTAFMKVFMHACSGAATVRELSMWLGSALIRLFMRCCMTSSEAAAL
jgi:uncharacterized metal-binding protein